jgi:hypothetical protein
MIGFGGGGKDSRTSHLWIARRDTQHLGKAPWETPVAEVFAGASCAPWKNLKFTGFTQNLGQL